MTIAQTDREVKELISNHHVYGLEVLINAIVRACENEPYVTKEVIKKLVDETRTDID